MPAPLNLSRRGALGLAGGLILALGLPQRPARAQAMGGTQHARKVPAYLTIEPSGRITLKNPFAEGGQGIHTAVAQLVAEELDADLASFTVETAPAGADYQVLFNGTRRVTGGSFSIRHTYAHFRILGATARAMLLQAAAQRLAVPVASLSTEPGFVIHPGGRIPYGALAEAAAALPIPADAEPKAAGTGFRLIGKPAPRLDTRAKSTGQARYGIDMRVDGMLQAAILHAPRAGADPGEVLNDAALRAMPGVHSVHRLPGAVAVLADNFWRARKAVEAAQVAWTAVGGQAVVPEDFSSASMLETLRSQADAPGNPASDTQGDAPAILRVATKTITADYDAPYLAHAQLEPPSATVRFNADGTLDVWTPNQAPEQFRAIAAREASLAEDRIRIHTPLLGGFFGRHFTYGTIHPMNQAIRLARATNRPVKVIWTREEEFARDAYRPMGFARLRASLGPDGRIAALHATTPGEGPVAKHFGTARLGNPPLDTSAVEGVAFKPYAIPNRRIEWVHVPHPINVGFWRSVGHSMNDFFLEAFLDEVAEVAGQDPLAFRRAHLAHSPRHLALLDAVVDLAGGWRRGPFAAPDGTSRARGLAMASPFGTEVATIAEVSLRNGEVVVHDLFIAIDPGSIVNPAIIRAQVESAAAIGLSAACFEEMGFEDGRPIPRNFDTYRILSRAEMPKVHVRILESGAPMGGVGEPGTPGVPPAVANAIAALTGRRIRSLPFAKERIGAA
ncbi:xanthine dehydrogenase family protein molybdopterin-binding subunit [Falsiroseomonas stagni]|uniref:Isoquinoline 1-oxidoreductase, beta subunit n=1 Tax=Falsiroseomonas stagni DSM 19981 TaxID=1123062 RepID=A0A1I4ERL5_9PROT|nr:xanthine dehydrogenase family protein molybdopterin-binding subunit [Falsiroseomonas stagni]SFL07177.1 isoquinoline 1-oxidoreductase, beta subunit [Falsiroseomonas stagni DSM 19981]